MHRYFARFLGCAVIGLALSLLQFLTPQQGNKVVSIRTNAQTADIVGAVEALGREDVSIKVSEEHWLRQPVLSTIFGTLSFAALLWCATGFIKRFEATYTVARE